MKYAYMYNNHQYCCVKSVNHIYFLFFMYFCSFIIPVVIDVDRPPSDKCTKPNITFLNSTKL